jgi:hypothetical protein
MTTINVEAVRNALPGVEFAITAVEAYEKPLYPDQLEAARSAVLALKTAVQAVAALIEAKSPYGLSLLPPAMIPPIEYVLKNADEARLELAAYAPHRESLATRHLRQRQKIATLLKELLQQGHSILTRSREAGGTPQQSRQRERPAYLRLITPREATQEGKEGQPEPGEGEGGVQL